MPFLVVAGITVPVAEGGASKLPPERVGSSGRAYAGNLRSTVRAEKRGWQARTGLLTNDEAAAIEAAVGLAAQVPCGGTALRWGENLLGLDADTPKTGSTWTGSLLLGYQYGGAGDLTLAVLGLSVGDTVSASVSVSSHSGGGTVSASIFAYNGSGAQIGGTTGVAVAPGPRASVAAFVIPAGTAYLVVLATSTTNGTIGTDDAMLHMGSTVRSYVSPRGPLLCEVTAGESGYINTTTTDATGHLRALLLTLREV
jgi:hypothetical protein